MGFETLYLYREIELDVSLEGPMTLDVRTECPTDTVAQRFSKALTATAGRVPVNVRLPGDTKGKLYQLKLSGGSVCVLYGVRVYAKPLGVKSAWGWYVVPMVQTPEGYVSSALPILPTPEGFGEARLPILPTPEGFGAAALPIVPTPEGWDRMRLPIRPTPPEPIWVDLPMDPIQ